MPDPPRRVGTGVLVALSTVVVFGALIVSAVAHSFLVSGQARIDSLSTEIRQEREGLEVDRVVLASHQSPRRIAEEARALGMVPAHAQTWISPGTGAAPVVVGGDQTDGNDGTAPTEEPPPIATGQPSPSELASAPTGGDGR